MGREFMMADRIEARQVIEASGDAPRLQLYVVVSSARSLAAVQEQLADHLAYVHQLEERHVLFAAGPLWTDDGQFSEGDGMLVYRAASVEQARELADADPMHASGARTYRLRPWLLTHGSIGVRESQSNPRREII
jgi:uncharacterized protein